MGVTQVSVRATKLSSGIKRRRLSQSDDDYPPLIRKQANDDDDNPFDMKTESSGRPTEELHLSPSSIIQIPIGLISRAEIVSLIKEAHRLGKAENKISNMVGYKTALKDIKDAGQFPSHFHTDSCAVMNIQGAPQLMKRLLHTLVPRIGDPPLIAIPTNFAALSSFTSQIIDPHCTLGFLNGNPVTIIVTSVISIGEPDSDLPSILGDVYISIGINGAPRHCFCIGCVTGTGTGIFVSEFRTYYFVTPENSLDPPWTEMNGHPGAFAVFDEQKNIKLTFEDNIRLQIPEIPEPEEGEEWDYSGVT